MKWKIIIMSIMSILMALLIGVNGENVTVELIPSDVNVYVGDTFNLDLIVENIPNGTISDGFYNYSGYCGGFQTDIYYDPSVLNISQNDVILSNVSNSASIKNVDVENGKINIQLAWFSNYPSGNFTIATLKFKALKPSNVVVSLSNTVISNKDGNYTWKVSNNNLILKDSNVTILFKPIADLIVPKLLNAEYGENITVPVTIAPKENETLKLIEGYLSYDKNMLKPVNVSSNVGTVFFNSSSGFFKIDNINQSNNFTINITYNVINVGNTTVKLDNVYMEDTNGSFVSNISSNATEIVIPGPDLVCEIVPELLKAYENNTISVVVKNIGERNVTNNFTVTLYADTFEIGSCVVNGLDVGQTKEVNFTFMPTEEKNYTLVAVVDTNNNVKEINEYNNKYVCNLYAVELPISVNLESSTNVTKIEYTFEVNLTLNNITPERPAKAIQGVLTYNPNVVECTNFTFLITPSEVNGTFLENITYEKGKVLFKLMDGNINHSIVIATAKFIGIDVGNSNIELSDLVVSDINGYKFNKLLTNNVSIIVQGPNLKIVNLSVPNPSKYRVPTTINVTITNNGHQDVNKSFNVALYADTEEIGEVTVNGLNISQVKTIVFNWTPDDTRTYTIVAVVDPNNVIKEENESDNKVVKEVKVIEIPVWVSVYNTTPVINGTFNATIEVKGIEDKRPCGGYQGVLILKNLKIENIELLGPKSCTNYTINNNELMFMGYNFTETGTFKIANITFKIIDENKNYSAILENMVLSDEDGYKFKIVFINNTILPEYLQNIFKGLCIESGVLDKLDIENAKLETAGNITLVILPLKIGNVGDELIIPKVSNNITINITDDVITKINSTLTDAKILDEITKSINDEEELNKTLDMILEKIEPILCEGFNITNKTKEEPKKINNKLIATIKFKAENTSNKGFAIVRIPIGELKVESIVVNNGTTNITLKENDINSNVGWYRYVDTGIIEITLINDPEVSITLAKTLPVIQTTTTTTYYYIGGGGGVSSIVKMYPNVAPDIKSEKIREFVYRAKLIVGSEIDLNLSAKCLKNESELIKQPIDITEDCILIGGPVANPLVKKYMWVFPVKVTNDYPGKHKGVIEKQIINGHTVILLAGSDRWGTKAAVEYFKTLDDIPSEPIFVEWINGTAIKINKP
ncbi:CARDB domain-containing protein [Methanocaldococcus sp. 28A]